jgi:hypothetical protein
MNAAVKSGLTHARKFTDCDCNEGFVAMKGKCVYAYLFQVHGRVWMAPYTKAQFGKTAQADFKKSMAKVLGLKAGQIRPYRVHNAKNIANDIHTAKLDHAKMILAETEAGAIRAVAGKQAISVAFAIVFKADSPLAGSEAVDDIRSKSAAFKQELDVVESGKVKYVKTFVWALGAEFTKDALSKADAYKWAPKTKATSYPTPVPGPPTAKPTRAPTTTIKPFKRGHICGTFLKKNLDVQEYTAYKKANTVFEIATKTGFPVQEFWVEKLHPFGRDSDVYYSPAHAKWTGSEITVCMNLYSVKEAYKARSAFKSCAPKIIFKSKTALYFDARTIKMTTANRIPTMAPTAKPTPAPQMPGSRPSCSDGVVMEISGQSNFQSSTRLTHGENQKAINFMNKARRCMTKLVNTQQKFSGANRLKYCNVRSTTFDEKAMDCRKALKDEHVKYPNQDTGDLYINPITHKRMICTKFNYNFKFLMSVPGQNMHNGNQVYDQLHFKNGKFMKELNQCVGAGYVGGKNLKDKDFRPATPTFNKLAVSAIELTYISSPKTDAPTAAPTGTDVHCKLSKWSEFSACSATCGKGTKQSWRMIIKDHQGNGKKCGALTKKATCEDVDCPIDCKMTEWSKMKKCSKTCGGGFQVKTRRVRRAAMYDGKKCGATKAKKVCNAMPCPVNCKTTAWDEGAGRCSAACGGGKKWLTRTIFRPSYYGGKACGKLLKSVACNQNECPTNCVVSEWSDWGSCSKSCAGKSAGTRLQGAVQERTRVVKVAPRNGGQNCPSLTQKKLCAVHPCGAHVCSASAGLFPLTCTYENNIVYTHHVNDVHDNELFMCYHNMVTEVCTCLCWPKSIVTTKDGKTTSNVNNF